MYNLKGPAFVVLNDELSENISDVQLKFIDGTMSTFMNTTWPEKVRCITYLRNE